ncbi:hypothetical protein HYC85_032113 [Camellia sinensis]|uniref:Uncharacterized protein n=1 Tax=Camellia sinensis TaxID=4442 RepID=A0A7J7FS94_CAMSI|nr:hypothetical protein HYC85_032113 [Camellia sinensis]
MRNKCRVNWRIASQTSCYILGSKCSTNLSNVKNEENNERAVNNHVCWDNLSHVRPISCDRESDFMDNMWARYGDLNNNHFCWDNLSHVRPISCDRESDFMDNLWARMVIPTESRNTYSFLQFKE